MLNRNYRKMDMSELDKVAGGIRVLGEADHLDNSGNFDKDLKDIDIVSIPRGGRVTVRV